MELKEFEKLGFDSQQSMDKFFSNNIQNEEYFILRVDENSPFKRANLLALRLYMKSISVDNPKLARYLADKYRLNYDSVTDEALHLHNEKVLKKIEFLFDCGSNILSAIKEKANALNKKKNTHRKLNGFLKHPETVLEKQIQKD